MQRRQFLAASLLLLLWLLERPRLRLRGARLRGASFTSFGTTSLENGPQTKLTDYFSDALIPALTRRALGRLGPSR